MRSSKTNLEAVKQGTGEAFYEWMSQHDISFPDTIQRGITDAFDKWLFDNTDEIIDRIAEIVAKRHS